MANISKMAVLIDGDNAESSLVEQVLAEAGRYGKVTVKRIYADWTNTNMRGWKEQVNTHAIRPIQKFSYTTGKNSTDSALIIDAMDLLHSKLVDGFCIVSSDSDYTGLAHRIREEGLFVMGIGRSHTPEAFIKACENFTYAEILIPADEKTVLPKPVKKAATQRPKKAATKKAVVESEPLPTPKAEEPANVLPTPAAPAAPENIGLHLIGSLKQSGIKPIDFGQIDTAFRMVASEDNGEALLSDFGVALRRVDSSFDPRNFGFRTFRKFCESLIPAFEVKIQKDGTTLSLKKIE